MIYVDDFHLSGPKENLARGWELLRSEDKSMGLSGLLIEEPYPVGWNAETGQRDGKSFYFGCYHSIHTVKVMEYDMSAFMENKR